MDIDYIMMSMINIVLSIFILIYVFIKVREINIKIQLLQETLLDRKVIKESDIDIEEDKPNFLSKLLSLEDEFDEEDLWDDDKIQQAEEEKERKRVTEEIIESIDYYEAKLHLNHRLCTDIKNKKYSNLTTEKLISLSNKYNVDDNITMGKSKTYINFGLKTVDATLPQRNKEYKRLFILPQNLVDYVANTSRMIYDKKANRVYQVHSFDTDDNGNLLIYYDRNSIPIEFEPYMFGVA